VWLNLGSARRSLGRHAESEAAFREATRLPPGDPAAWVWLGRSLVAQGKEEEGLAEMRRGLAEGAKRPGWAPPPEDWLREAERQAALAPRLDDFLADKVKAATPEEGLTWAEVCAARGRHAAAARAYTAAFAAGGPELPMPALVPAACSAARAGCGGGRDAPPGDAARAALRAQARAWLAAALGSIRKAIPELRGADLARARQDLRLWQRLDALAPLRRPETLALLPAAERAGWQALWDDVEGLLRLAGPEP
jgi:hypothetical protein